MLLYPFVPTFIEIWFSRHLMCLNVLYPGMLMIVTVHGRQIAELKLLCAQKFLCIKQISMFLENSAKMGNDLKVRSRSIITYWFAVANSHLFWRESVKRHGGKCAASSLLPRPRILRRLLDRVFLFAFLANFYMHLVSVHR